MEIRTIKRLGVGLVDQIYYNYIPPGGIKVSESLLATAKAAGDLQIISDQRFQNRDALGSLGMVIHSYAHVLALDFVRHAKIPYEYHRKTVSSNLMVCSNQ